MKENAFRMLDLISRGYISEGNWGIDTLSNTSTKEYFGTAMEREVSGRWLTVYTSDREADYILDEMPEANFSMEMAERDNGHVVTLHFYNLD